MRQIRIIGIGAGNPEFVTMQAVEALNEATVFFVVGKGETKGSLLSLREEICRRYIRDQAGFRVVEIADPPRDRAAEDYAGAVSDWHDLRAGLFGAAIREHLTDDGCGAFLVWGDPALYDSTLRVLDRVRERGFVPFDYSVIPGITSVQALAAAHRMPLNRTGEPVHITTGRRLASGFPVDLDTVLVMLDAGLACEGFDDPALRIYWGAYLGTPDEVLITGRLVDVAKEITAVKRQLRSTHGWIMDTYLIQRPIAHRPDISLREDG